MRMLRRLHGRRNEATINRWSTASQIAYRLFVRSAGQIVTSFGKFSYKIAIMIYFKLYMHLAGMLTRLTIQSQGQGR